MPFDVMPQEEVKVGLFADVADAILRGCAIHTKQARHAIYDPEEQASCVIGAAFIGLGVDVSKEDVRLYARHWDTPVGKRLERLVGAYLLRYGEMPQNENNSGRFTREQIARRIREL